MLSESSSDPPPLLSSSPLPPTAGLGFLTCWAAQQKVGFAQPCSMYWVGQSISSWDAARIQVKWLVTWQCPDYATTTPSNPSIGWPGTFLQLPAPSPLTTSVRVHMTLPTLHAYLIQNNSKHDYWCRDSCMMGAYLLLLWTHCQPQMKLGT